MVSGEDEADAQLGGRRLRHQKKRKTRMGKDGIRRRRRSRRRKKKEERRKKKTVPIRVLQAIFP
jgi:hypothetical protein